MKNLSVVIVVDDPDDWDPSWRGVSAISAQTYLSDPIYQQPGLRVINLCRHDRSLSLGYYTSLLAEARGQRALPTNRTLQNLSSKRMYADQLEELNRLVQKSLSRIIQEDFCLSVYFGQNLAAAHAKLSQSLFTLFPCPLFKVFFQYRDEGWQIHSLKPLGLGQIPSSHLGKVREAMVSFLSRRWHSARNRPVTGYDVAILHNPKEQNAPSNQRALRGFIRAGTSIGLNVELITKHDYPRLLEFDGLFLRETTALHNHTYRFAAKAEREGMAVIDSTDAIRRCSNKVFLHELLSRHGMKVPKTLLAHEGNLTGVMDTLGFPMVVKLPDSAFSLGVFKVETPQQLQALAQKLWRTSDIFLAQEFIPTEFDWRVGILDQQALFVCRYYMSRNHWQIYNHTAKGDDSTGEFSTLHVEDAPKTVLDTALAAVSLLGDGLYGVDLKETPHGVFIIEINDNPNVDAGVEDAVLGQDLYLSIMRALKLRIERTKRTPVSSAAEA